MNQPSPTEKQRRILWFAFTALAVAVVVALIAALCWGVGWLTNLLSPVLVPLAIAAVVACLLSPVVDFFERRQLSRLRALIIVFVLGSALAAGILISMIRPVAAETQQLVSNIPQYSQRIQQRISHFIAQPPPLLRSLWPAQFGTTTDTNSPAVAAPAPGAPAATGKPLTAATDWVTDNLSGLGKWLWGQVGRIVSGFGMMAGLLLVPVYTFYFLLEKRVIEDRWRDYLPLRDSGAKEETIFVLTAIGQYLVAFFRGQVLVAICDGVLYTVGFLAMGLNYSLLLGCAAILLTIIPFLGAIVLCLAALTLAFVQYGDWLHPLLVLAVFTVVQTLESLFISPKIMGDRVGLHPLVIIVAVMTGTTLLGGILGGILAIPLAAALRVIMFRYIWKKREV
jgi:predicted PurR-regulated permease PerM